MAVASERRPAPLAVRTHRTSKASPHLNFLPPLPITGLIWGRVFTCVFMELGYPAFGGPSMASVPAVRVEAWRAREGKHLWPP